MIEQHPFACMQGLLCRQNVHVRDQAVEARLNELKCESLHRRHLKHFAPNQATKNALKQRYRDSWPVNVGGFQQWPQVSTLIP